MYYETDARVVEWFDRAVRAPSPLVRARVARLLESVDCRSRARWLGLLARDPDREVAAAATFAIATLDARDPLFEADLIASDFMAGAQSHGSEWEWEYAIMLCSATWIPVVPVRVWLRVEDDEAAREMARMRSVTPDVSAQETVAVIVDKRPVNRFTRSPRGGSNLRAHNRTRGQGP